MSTQADAAPNPTFDLVIYVAEHCMNCAYAYEVADRIRHDYPQVTLQIVDVSQPDAVVPEAVFATPTYLLNGRVWSLGNPSSDKISDTFAAAAVVVDASK